MKYFLLTIACVLSAVTAYPTIYGRLEGDTLRIGNDLIERVFVWNGGNLITHSLNDKTSGHCWMNRNSTPDFSIYEGKIAASNAGFETRIVEETKLHPRYGETIVTFSLGGLDVKRVFRVYDNSPTITTDTYLRGTAGRIADERGTNKGDMGNIESDGNVAPAQISAVIDQIKLDGKHWHTRVVEFYDVTDWNNNLVFETDIIPYRKNTHRGNLLFAHNTEIGKGLFFLKEAPSSSVQLAYAGHDFTTEFGHFAVTGLGLTTKDVLQGEWRKSYGSVIGLYSGSEPDRLIALRSYQKNIRRLLPGRDEMVMMNTWGDRSQDLKVNEGFCLAEVEKAARLGISHFQIDDGWQVGKSPNSALAGGSFKNIWDNPDYWKPDPEKYPRGLRPVVDRARELGVEVCLWYNPSVQDDYADWEKDACAMAGLYEEYGIRTFKIDGLAIPTKQSEINLRKLFDRVLELTDSSAVFNLDATAGRRAGYHMMNEYGNIFLENRYTDWQNYYPYWTLRNLWQLSKYVQAEKLQIEFLNKWRNGDKYGGDIYAPANYSFSYLFATAMAAQPLAWFEGSGLPDEAMNIAGLIADYREIQHDFHSGTILPVGDEPSGQSWTGFQSVNDGRGYFIFFRENNPRQSAMVETWLPEGAKVKFTPIAGHGKAMSRVAGYRGAVRVELPSINDFAFYRYEIIDSPAARRKHAD